jgi:hypothetical protein
LVARVYIFIEFTVLAYFFSLHISNKFVKKFLLFIPAAFLVFSIYDFSTEKVPGIPFLPVSVAHITLLCFIVYYFFEVMQETVAEPIYHKAIFWISVAFIINSSGNFFLFLYGKYSYEVNVFKTPQYTIIYTTVTIIKNLLLCIAILIKETAKNESDKVIFDVDLDSFNPSKNQY